MTERFRGAWHILTGEYPPANGGVSDYTRQVARGLAASGGTVHVWAPAVDGAPVDDAGVTVHRLPSVFGPAALVDLARGLARTPGPRRVLVQYVPHAFGMRGMNLAFCAWIAARRAKRNEDEQVWLMLHEVAYPWKKGQRPGEAVLAVVNRIMAALVVLRADRVFVSVPFWDEYMRAFLPRCPPATWLPILSNLPTVASEGARARVRAALGIPASARVIGHFGTYGSHIAPLLAATIDAFDAPPGVVWMMLGRGGPAFVSSRYPGRAGMVAPGSLDDHAVADHLAACDVLLQPYADGVSARRTSVMAGLALGRPVVTNDGQITEAIWRGGAVALADRPDAALLASALGSVVRDPALASKLSAAGRSLYDTEFSIERTMRTLHQNQPGHP